MQIIGLSRAGEPLQFTCNIPGTEKRGIPQFQWSLESRRTTPTKMNLIAILLRDLGISFKCIQARPNTAVATFSQT